MRILIHYLKRNSYTKRIATAILTLLTPLAATSQTSVVELGVINDGVTDNTETLQQLLDNGPSQLYFPDGKYLLGTTKIPNDRSLVFAPKAEIRLNPDQITLDSIAEADHVSRQASAKIIAAQTGK